MGSGWALRLGVKTEQILSDPICYESDQSENMVRVFRYPSNADAVSSISGGCRLFDFFYSDYPINDLVDNPHISGHTTTQLSPIYIGRPPSSPFLLT